MCRCECVGVSVWVSVCQSVVQLYTCPLMVCESALVCLSFGRSTSLLTTLFLTMLVARTTSTNLSKKMACLWLPSGQKACPPPTSLLASCVTTTPTCGGTSSEATLPRTSMSALSRYSYCWCSAEVMISCLPPPPPAPPLPLSTRR